MHNNISNAMGHTDILIMLRSQLVENVCVQDKFSYNFTLKI